MNSYKKGLVSVVIPTCDRGELFYKAVNSVGAQTYKNIEVIIVDDNSHHPIDESRFKCEFPIIIHRNNENVGGAVSRNIGVELSSGEFVCFLDDDDIYLENKIADLVKELQIDDTIDAVFGRVVKKSDPERRLPKSILENGGFLKSLKTIGYLHTNTSLIRHETFAKIKFDERLRKFQDTQLHIELIKKFKCKYIEIDVATWNDQHGLNQITDMKTKAQYKRGIDSYALLFESLQNKKLLNYKDRFSMFLKLTYLKIVFNDKFETDVKSKSGKMKRLAFLILLYIKKLL